MILFFKTPQKSVIATETNHQLTHEEINELCWLYGDATLVESDTINGFFIGPRREMITPWSTNAVEITQNMSLNGISRIEEYFPVNSKDADHDPMLQRMYEGLDQDIFTINHQPEPIKHVDNLEEYNEQEGLALSKEEIEYLHKIEKELGRPLTDSEIFGFAQINSEHCRHKIFGGTFIIDGQEMESSLFAMIKKTTNENPNKILSAYKDNVAFAQGPVVEQFAPSDQSTSDYFVIKDIESVISLKAETHNFPTTVEPFNGAATGTGGEIRDRMGGGTGSWPIAGTAVYMTAYPRLHDNGSDSTRDWEDILPVRQWLYQTPEQILIKASNGASDFGNKFGQPLICGSVLTFEHKESNEKYAYDKVIMLAGGVGYGTKRDCLKKEPQTGNKVVVVGGDNYRIGLGGGSVSSVDTGRYSNGIELNAVQRANPEMQKRAYNLVRALCEEDTNPVVSIHDHGSAGHLNCLSELVEECGGRIDMTKLPIGDKTLSSKEIIANESQERMGLLIDEKHIDHVRMIAERERAPMYVVGETTGDAHFSFVQGDGVKPFDLDVAQMFGHSPKTIMTDETVERHYEDVTYSYDPSTDFGSQLDNYVERVLQLEAVACKDWLTNKVDRSVTGKIARQQCQGRIQLPLSDCGVVALDYRGKKGIATSIGHAPQAGLASPEAGSVLSVAEALTNIVWAPLADGMDSLSLSANWMWPCRSQKGEDARLYTAVKALSDFCCAIQVNVPTGKDSLSLSQQYPNGEKIISPGTVIVSAGGEVSDIRKVVSPVLVNDKNTSIYHIDFSFDKQRLGGSAFAQSLGKIGDDVPTVKNPEYFRDAFHAVQELVKRGWIMAGHDISAGGMITALLEMCFANTAGGASINLYNICSDGDIVKTLMAENPGVIVEISDKHKDDFYAFMEDTGVGFAKIGYPTPDNRTITVKLDNFEHEFDIDKLRDVWYRTSYLLDRKQSMNGCAEERFANYKRQPVEMKFSNGFTGKLAQYGISAERRKPSGIKAAIIREKGTNGEREMAYSLYLAGFDVKDVMMTDLISGRETLEDINMIVFCGGFSNSDVLGSAKGWAGAFLYNPKAKEALDKFYARKDTLSLGICNGCQLMVELNLLNPEHENRARMQHNNSRKFESEFISLRIPQNNSVMFGSLGGCKLGLWVAHGEGKFSLPEPEDKYNVIAKYNYEGYPGNPNGSDYNVAGICSADGRHLAMMPHLERAIFPWQNAWYPDNRRDDEVTPWIEAFVNARKWVERKISQ
ncbi:phosphoribosylformylglycinamidine synthase [Xylanibacter muris]|uniref:Phosphoribosylformylglycinamidine synthase n=1 Tax=Xylanibacter muris TaxID=2736290 RepID=A0ABX2ALZ6_9BACT|nr:phosphoribosylformylglycinamidine synthase [Xylanibacter muris]NPD91800.1 phosphoribosylformylglycinamidine synthase [Xylanibacter muris]